MKSMVKLYLNLSTLKLLTKANVNSRIPDGMSDEPTALYACL
ncbi:MAG: hypothetical protein QXQ04_08705 [Candidatus Bathyarchaeia archaeon]